MAAAWARPVPEPVRLAAEQHDIGWMDWDRAPELNPQTGYPYTFTELPRDVHVSIWSGAADPLLTQSRYAALLVSMHGTGLYERFPPKGANGDEQQAIDRYLSTERMFQRALRHELLADPATVAGDAALIAALDWLSLGLCLDWAPRRIEGFTLLADTIEPWPFRETTVEFACEGLRLEAPVQDQAALDRALDTAALVDVRFELKAS